MDLLLLFRTIKRRSIFVLFLFIIGCSGLEHSEDERLRRRNCVGERIYRGRHDYFAPISTPTHTPREAYPWEVQSALPKVTKEFFRCRGSSLHAAYSDVLDPGVLYSDCGGSSAHGLPIIGGKEGVYPILIDLLNYVQKKTCRKVIVTSGHLCPIHNLYNDPSKDNRTSKHQIGGEVDFYVEGMEDRAQEVVSILLSYYQGNPLYQGQREWVEFQRYEKSDAHVSTQPWFNKEVYIKLCLQGEGRDYDNQHSHPYISIQVRYDRDRQERVLYQWEKAHQGYPRY